MKPLERNIVWPIVFFIMALGGGQRIMPLLKQENIYLIIAWTFVSVAFLFLGICYFTPLFSKKWYRWLYLIAGIAFLISIIAEWAVIDQMGIWKILKILHFSLFAVSLVLLFYFKTSLRNKFLWAILMFFIPFAGSIYFFIRYKQKSENQSTQTDL